MKKIKEIAKKLSINEEDLIFYGDDKAKIKESFIDKVKSNKNGKLEDYKKVINFFENNYKSKKFKILFVFQKEIQQDYYNTFKDNKFVVLYTIKEFAKDTDTEKGGDIQGWYSSFAYATNNQKFKKNKLKAGYTYLKENGFKEFIKRIFHKN